MSETTKFVNQLGGFSYYLTQKLDNGQKLSEADTNSVNELYNWCVYVQTVVNDFASDLNDNFSFATSKNAPTCRSTDMPYEKGVNYTVVIDGFIVSKNIKVEKILNIDTDFKYSDHNPVYLEFSFN